MAAADLCQRLLKLDSNAAKNGLTLLAQQELIRTWCAYYFRRSFDEWAGSPTDAWDNDLVPADFWESFRRNALLGDWPNAMFSASGHNAETHVHGVRFSGADIEAYAERTTGVRPVPVTTFRPVTSTLAELQRAMEGDNAAKGTAAKARTRQEHVSPAAYDQWFDSLPPEDQRVGYRTLDDRAKTHFSPRHVARKLSEMKTKALGRRVGRPRAENR